MKLTRRHKEGAEVSTESLNDIMFFLLLFFLIISTLANPSVLKITLPNTEAHHAMQKQQITLSVDKDHQYAVNDHKITFDNLEPALKMELAKINVNPTIVLKLDNSLSIQDLADVMQIGFHLNVKMVLATKATTK
jgi:biopolymer transport protein ExbD